MGIPRFHRWEVQRTGFDKLVGEKMDFVTNIFSVFGNINFTVIFQLLCVTLIMISGPVVIFLLALRGGDL